MPQVSFNALACMGFAAPHTTCSLPIEWEASNLNPQERWCGSVPTACEGSSSHGDEHMEETVYANNLHRVKRSASRLKFASQSSKCNHSTIQHHEGVVTSESSYITIEPNIRRNFQYTASRTVRKKNLVIQCEPSGTPC